MAGHLALLMFHFGELWELAEIRVLVESGDENDRKEAVRGMGKRATVAVLSAEKQPKNIDAKT